MKKELSEKKIYIHENIEKVINWLSNDVTINAVVTPALVDIADNLRYKYRVYFSRTKRLLGHFLL